jgi:hypothetical protein
MADATYLQDLTKTENWTDGGLLAATSQLLLKLFCQCRQL